MELINTFLSKLKLTDDYLDEEEEEIGTEPEEEEQPALKKTSFFSKRFSKNEEEELPEEEEPVHKAAPAAVKAAPASAARWNSAQSSQKKGGMTVSMIKPASMEDARSICDTLLEGKSVIINLEGVDVDLAQRIIDFSSGACYYSDGNFRMISSCIFMISPGFVELTGDFREMLPDGKNSLGARSSLIKH